MIVDSIDRKCSTSVTVWSWARSSGKFNASLLTPDCFFVFRIVPYAGYLTIVLNDYPMLKFVVLGGMLVSVLLQKDPNA